MISSASLIPFVDAIAQWLSPALSNALLTWGLFYAQTLVLAVMVLVRTGPTGLVSRYPGLHLVRGALLALAFGLMFQTLRSFELTDAVALFLLQPMFVQVFARLFLHESFGWNRWLASLLGFSGALLIVSPGRVQIDSDALLPILSGACHAGYVVLTRAARQTDPVLTMQFSAGLGATALASLAIGVTLLLEFPLVIRPITVTVWLTFGLLGMLSAVAYTLLAAATQRAEASLLAPWTYTGIVAVVVLGAVAFSEWPDPVTSTGLVLIASGGMLSSSRTLERRAAVSSLGDTS